MSIKVENAQYRVIIRCLDGNFERYFSINDAGKSCGLTLLIFENPVFTGYSLFLWKKWISNPEWHFRDSVINILSPLRGRKCLSKLSFFLKIGENSLVKVNGNHENFKPIYYSNIDQFTTRLITKSLIELLLELYHYTLNLRVRLSFDYKTLWLHLFQHFLFRFYFSH